MTVCQITTVHNAYDTRILYKECFSLKEKNFEVYLIAVHDKETDINGVKIIPLKKPKNRFERLFFTNLTAFIKAFKLNSDIYHFHDPEFMFFAYLLKLIKRKKVIYDVHEDYPGEILIKDWIPSKFLKNILSKIFIIIERFFSKKYDALILAQDTYLKRFHFFKNKIIILNNYPILNDNSLNFSKDFNENQSFNLIYSGSINKERGVWIMINSFKLLLQKRKDVKLFLVGYFTNLQLYKDVKEYLINNNLTDNVIIIGGDKFVKRDEIDKLYKKMDIGLIIFPYYEYFKDKILTKFFEYMLFELPVVATDFPLWKDFFDKNKCGVVVNLENLEEIIKKLDYLIDNENLRNEMGKRGRELVLKYYNWDIEKLKLLNLYKELSC
ncbi:MAG: glycosyltransferase family 4 protein [Caldisericia bacterium]